MCWGFAGTARYKQRMQRDKGARVWVLRQDGGLGEVRDSFGASLV